MPRLKVIFDKSERQFGIIIHPNYKFHISYCNAGPFVPIIFCLAVVIRIHTRSIFDKSVKNCLAESSKQFGHLSFIFLLKCYKCS